MIFHPKDTWIAYNQDSRCKGKRFNTEVGEIISSDNNFDCRLRRKLCGDRRIWLKLSFLMVNGFCNKHF